MTTPPDSLQHDLRRARRLEWWTLFWQGSIVAVMALVLGSSQAMKSAWIEDMLGLVPAIVFLISVRLERREPTDRFPYGFHRSNSLAFLVSATALVAMGGYLLADSAMKLIAQEHPTIGQTTVFGQQLWLGWLMMAALAYSVVPPMILGRIKQPIARRLSDKVMHTDSLMQKADWMTGLTGVLGVGGVGFGLWWADSLAAAIIALDILHDGYRTLRQAAEELADGAPRALESDAIAEDAAALQEHLGKLFPDARIQLRETGRYIRAEVTGATPPAKPIDPTAYWPGSPETAWRLISLTISR